jgi:hypothetical protein
MESSSLPSTLIGLDLVAKEPEPGQVYRIGSKLSEFIFEYHPETKRVYMGRVGIKPMIGELVADNIVTHGDALNAVLVWHRGYRTAKLEIDAPKDPVPGLDKF